MSMFLGAQSANPIGNATFPDGSVKTSKYQGWCEKHGKVWLYDYETKKPDHRGGCGVCYHEQRDPKNTSCPYHGIQRKGDGGRCVVCVDKHFPAMEDLSPPLDFDPDPSDGGVPADGVGRPDSVEQDAVPGLEVLGGGEDGGRDRSAEGTVPADAGGTLVAPPNLDSSEAGTPLPDAAEQGGDPQGGAPALEP